MGRKQHQSDKLYLTTQEWKYFFGGKKPGRATDPDEIDFKRLPFDHCSLSLQPFANPYCDDEVLTGWPVILLSKKDTSLGLFPYFLILLSFFGLKLVLNILLWLQNYEI